MTIHGSIRTIKDLSVEIETIDIYCILFSTGDRGIHYAMPNKYSYEIFIIIIIKYYTWHSTSYANSIQLLPMRI